MSDSGNPMLESRGNQKKSDYLTNVLNSLYRLCDTDMVATQKEMMDAKIDIAYR